MSNEVIYVDIEPSDVFYVDIENESYVTGYIDSSHAYVIGYIDSPVYLTEVVVEPDPLPYVIETDTTGSSVHIEPSDVFYVDIENESYVTGYIDSPVYLTDVVIEPDPLPYVVETNVGPSGLSAYGIALTHGFVGTEEEWLSSLKSVTRLSIPLSGLSFTYQISAKYIQTTVIDDSGDEVSVVIRHYSDRLEIESLVSLDNHTLLLTYEE